MPIYEYECEACGNRFELIQKFSDPLVEICPKCGERKVHKLLSSPAIKFKGTGWYITDYAKKGGGESESKSGEKSDPKAGDKGAPAKSDKSEKSDRSSSADSSGSSAGTSSASDSSSGKSGSSSSSGASSSGEKAPAASSPKNS